MIGINVENLDKLVKINNLNYDSLEDNISNLLSTLDELSECYVGKDINFIFSPLVEQDNNIKKIPAVVKSYSDVLSMVKISYQRQDANFQELLNHSSTKIEGRR